MTKYKNKDGTELNYTGNDVQSTLTREVVEEAIKIISEYNRSDYEIYFANGGDRGKNNVPEMDTCRLADVTMLWGIGGGKIQSSSWLINGGKGE